MKFSQSELYDKLNVSLQRLVGQECWGFAAGDGTGSVISLHIGNKIPHTTLVDNPHLSHDMRKFDAEYVLFIESVWRLDDVTEIICGAWDDNTHAGRMLPGLEKLVGQRIEKVTLFAPAMDATILFANELSLKLFCDQINETDAGDNYTLFTGREALIVGSRSKLSLIYATSYD